LITGCRRWKGMIRDGFVTSFLFREGETGRDEGGPWARVVMDDRMEGWLGIPHGGVAMGMVATLAGVLRPGPAGGTLPYPFTAEFRWGGPRLRTGDEVTVRVGAAGEGIGGEVVPVGGTSPYLRASLAFGVPVAGGTGDADAPPFPAGDLTPLPHYRNCFVCGVGRRAPGLWRRFYHLPSPGGAGWVLSPVGGEETDRRSFYLFLDGDGTVHPLALLALIDETLGWGGFLITRQGAVTVRLRFVFHRPVPAGAQIVVFGRGGEVRGRSPSRMLFTAEGGAAVRRSGGVTETCVTAAGQWMVLPELTDQMRRELIPPDNAAAAFRLASSPCDP